MYCRRRSVMMVHDISSWHAGNSWHLSILPAYSGVHTVVGPIKSASCLLNVLLLFTIFETHANKLISHALEIWHHEFLSDKCLKGYTSIKLIPCADPPGHHCHPVLVLVHCFSIERSIIRLQYNFQTLTVTLLPVFDALRVKGLKRIMTTSNGDVAMWITHTTEWKNDDHF